MPKIRIYPVVRRACRREQVSSEERPIYAIFHGELYHLAETTHWAAWVQGKAPQDQPSRKEESEAVCQQ